MPKPLKIMVWGVLELLEGVWRLCWPQERKSEKKHDMLVRSWAIKKVKNQYVGGLEGFF